MAWDEPTKITTACLGPEKTEANSSATSRLAAITSGDPTAPEHIAALDGLRGLAVLVVIVHHLHYTFPLNTMLPPGPVRRELEFAAYNGWLGVDVFFVLSGFLITGILLKSRAATNYYGVFYVRRLLRIAPLYFAVVAFAFFSTWPNSVLPTHADWSTQLWWWLNASNLRTAFAPQMLPVLGLFWSLAVEEQFYLLWPTVVRRVTRGTLVVLALLCVLAEVILRVLPPVLRMTASFPEAIYRLTPLHCDGLLLGAALAVGLREGFVTARALPWFRATALLATLVSVAMLHAGWRFYTTPMIALATTALVGWVVLRGNTGKLARLLAWTPLRLCGRYSYCMYVTQTLLLVLAGQFLLRWWDPAVGWAKLLYCYGTVLLASFVLGAASWRWFEGPVNARKRNFPYRFAAASNKA